MLVNNLGKNKIKVTLSALEITKIFGSYENIDYSNPEIKVALNILLDKATEISNTEFEDGALFVEVYPTALGGCNIYFTKIKPAEKQTKRFKQITQNHLWNILEFANSTDLINAMKCLYKTNSKDIIKSSLYKCNDNYYLLTVCSKPIFKKFFLIREFAQNIYFGKTICAVIAEHSEQIVKDNAIQKLGTAFKENLS